MQQTRLYSNECYTCRPRYKINMSASHHISNIIRCMNENGLSPAGFIQQLLNSKEPPHRTARESLFRHAPGVCEAFYKCTETKQVVVAWSISVAKRTMCQEVEELTREKYGLHFKAKSATAEQQEGFMMNEIATTMRNGGPYLWEVVMALLDSIPDRRRVNKASRAEPTLFVGQEMDLGEFGGDDMGREGNDDDDDGEEGGTMADNDGGSIEGSAHRKKRARRAASRNMALLVIKAVVSISIFLQSSNERCNYLQGILGFFCHSTCVPEKVIETLAHAGLSISIKSIDNAVASVSKEISNRIKKSAQTLRSSFAYDNFDIDFKTWQPTLEKRSSFVSATSATIIPLYGVDNADVLRCSAELWAKDFRNPLPTSFPLLSETRKMVVLHKMDRYSKQPHPDFLSPCQEAFTWHIRDILVRHGQFFGHFLSELGEPDPVHKIPVHKTDQVPCRAMNIKQSTTDGNIEVMEDLLRQGGLGDVSDAAFDATREVNMSDHVILVHGDLLTKERLESVRESRSIEETPRNRFQYLIFLPGLFHYKMACVDALFRTYLQPKEGRDDENSLYQHLGLLRPDKTGKMISKPGFRRMHEVVHHDLWASILDCWRIEAQSQDRAWTTLELFA
ncbi:hypothetical protein PAXRUDRAFT_710260, partial [Paxillus rubicundulus Ve08.2h10]